MAANDNAGSAVPRATFAVPSALAANDNAGSAVPKARVALALAARAVPCAVPAKSRADVALPPAYFGNCSKCTGDIRFSCKSR